MGRSRRRLAQGMRLTGSYLGRTEKLKLQPARLQKCRFSGLCCWRAGAGWLMK
jgi:hypothetical protein